MKAFRLLTISALAATSLLAGCGGSGGSSDSPNTPTTPTGQSTGYSYFLPVEKADGWQIASATELGLDVSLMETLVDRIDANEHGYRRMDGILVIKDGQLIFEKHFRTQTDVSDGWIGNSDLELHAVHSVTKSVMSAAIGIALEQGLIGSIDDPVADYFPEYANVIATNEAKQRMTIRDWLTMQSGFAWDEWNVNYLDNTNQNKRMIDSADPMGFLFAPADGHGAGGSVRLFNRRFLWSGTNPGQSQ